MERLYKRLVTVGMITISAVLAWIYCILEYRDEAFYVIGASLVVVASLYVLLLTYISLKSDKESKLRNYISATIAENLLKMQKSGNEDDVIRLLKAMYVQIRKRNESDTNEIVAASINKAMKVIIKYNQSNNDALVASIATLSAELDAIKSKLDTMKIATPSTDNTPFIDDLAMTEDAPFNNPADTNLDMFQEEIPEGVAVTQESSENANITDMETQNKTSIDASTIAEHAAEDIPAPQSDVALAESFFEAFGMEEEPIKEDAVADVIPFPSAQAEDFDPEPTTIANPE